VKRGFICGKPKSVTKKGQGPAVRGLERCITGGEAAPRKGIVEMSQFGGHKEQGLGTRHNGSCAQERGTTSEKLLVAKLKESIEDIHLVWGNRTGQKNMYTMH